MDKELLEKIQSTFLIREIESIEPINAGNINSTFKVKAKGATYIIQKINKYVFKNPPEIMQNIRRVSRHLKKKVLLEGGDPNVEVLHPIDTLDATKFLIYERECYDKEGKPYIDEEYWRMYDWIEGAKTYDNIDSPEIFYEVGKAFGRFQKRLADYPVENLHEAIPDFHNTPKRLMDFKLAILADKAGRLKAIKGQKDHPLKLAIDKIMTYENELNLLEVGKLSGELPIRVAHNDTKINNVMIDEQTGKAICVIDLDTVGKGTLEDYGDAIRSGANPAGEEPENIEDAQLDLELFEAYTRGYLEETLVFNKIGEINEDPKMGLTKNEVEMLYKAPKILALELAMRFITDYLNGDEYFKLKEGQPADFNLTRGLVQLHLAEDMNSKEEQMKEIVEKIVEEIKDKKLKVQNRSSIGVEPDDDEGLR